MARLAIEWATAAAVSLTCLCRFLTEDFLARSPTNDRGYYIACSKLIVGGGVLYRDLFDNKPPMIHLLGALAWWLLPDVRAVFQMERIALLLLAGVIFAMLRFGLGVRLIPSLGGLVIGLITLRNPEVFSGGHLTEEYGILFETVAITCLLLALRLRRETGGHVWATAAGAFGALTLLTRQTFLVSIVAICAAAHAPLAREPRRLVHMIAWEVVGFAVPTLAGCAGREGGTWAPLDDGRCVS